MIKKRGRSMAAERGAFLSPSSALLDNHLDELLETMEEVHVDEPFALLRTEQTTSTTSPSVL